MFDLLRHTAHRARKERLAQIAGSLAFTTVLSAVPFLGVCLALFTRFPVFHRFEDALEQQLLRSLLPPEIARTVLRYLDQFATNAGSLTLAASCFLLLTALALMLTVENALNQIWNVRRARPLWRRLGLYLLMLAAGPPLLGVSLWAMSTLLGVSLGLIGTLPPSVAFVLDLGPALLNLAGLTALYRFVPNAPVRRRDAFVGALLATVVLDLGKRGVGAYLLKAPTYKAVYGAFAALPVFLLWVYFSWLVTLAAALLAAGLGRGKRPGARA